ncbi:MAG TPA: CmpA/NrtA family ABC transporter substrate-binding protein, partial [Hyphomicrobiaceae bacterium]|nr:CmpA/NrtA family ABC transporter substrate-binding protein [Hyphomicrobiaceae bacterium]
MSQASGHDIRAGFMPLVDCAPLIVAGRLGFAKSEGLRLSLVRESSWATLRDRISVRQLDAAHMLAPMPIAANLGLTPLAVPLVAPLSLGFGGNTVTVSRAVWQELAAVGAPGDLRAGPASEAMARLIETRRAAGGPRLVIAIVHSHSAHHYQLAYWLRAGGVDSAREVDIVVLPPPLMPAALAQGHIDGFCAGEPWGSVAVDQGAGCLVTTSAHIWQAGPEKVLGVRRDFAESQPEIMARLVRAVYRAAVWCDDPANRVELAAALSAPDVLDQPASVILRSLERRLVAPTGGEVAIDGLMTFAHGAAAYPWISHAAWLYAQMVALGQVRPSPGAFAAACSAFRPDLTRMALARLEIPLPLAVSKIEGVLAVPTAVAA